MVGSGIGNTWQDVSDSYGIGTVAQLSYSAAWSAIVATFADGSAAYYDDSYNAWYALESASGAPVATDFSWDQYFQRNFYGAGGIYEAWCSSHNPDGSCYFTFQISNAGWNDITTQPVWQGQQIYCNPIDENWGVTVLNGADPQIPINIVEGSYLQWFSNYGGGPADTGYKDFMWVQTSELRVYVFEINGPC